MGKSYSETVVLKLGGSLIVPNGGLDIKYIEKFYNFLTKQIAEKNRRFFLFTGGGMLARHYRDAGVAVTGNKLPMEELDWLGTHATRLNAQLFRTIFRDIAHPYIIFNYDTIQKTEKPLIVAGGWKPGWSTDYCAATLAQDYNVKTIVKMSNADHVYDKDPRKYKDAKPFNTMTWDEYLNTIGDDWKPGRSVPIDPVGAKLARDNGVKVIYLHGSDLENVTRALNGKKFVGTTIE